MTIFNSNYLLKALTPNTITFWLRASTYEWGGGVTHTLLHNMLSGRPHGGKLLLLHQAWCTANAWQALKGVAIKE